MLFHTLDFLYFFLLFFILYWFVFKDNLKLQNLLVLVASSIFYGWWDYRFLSLIFISTLVDYYVGLGIANNNVPRKRKLLLAISLIVNIGMLGVFKYFNFFAENLHLLLNSMGLGTNRTLLNIILPVGISFYTFQTLSYTIDVFRDKIKPTNNFISFAAFVSFFPQLVAGPIERASNLLPQFFKPRKFNYGAAVDGSKQILWGLFKKVVIADKAGELADMIFNNSGDLNGSTLMLGIIFFSFQIYGDFSGYSDIAIGLARLLGFSLMDNFAFPYFSRDIAEFWRRWHISLSTWFRDYLYIPLGGSRGSIYSKVRNIFIIFLVSGFWHGANWTFIFWGLLNALYFLPVMLLGINRHNLDIVRNDNLISGLKNLLSIIITFGLVAFSWIFFRAEDLSHAFRYVNGLFVNSFVPEASFSTVIWGKIIITFALIIFFITMEWRGRFGKYGLQAILVHSHRYSRWSLYSVLIFLVLIYYQIDRTPFIYFQF